jgi:nicotinate dehydrogenase subunit A
MQTSSIFGCVGRTAHCAVPNGIKRVYITSGFRADRVEFSGRAQEFDSPVLATCERKSIMPQISLNVNGKARTVNTAPDTPLLYVLRDNLELHGPRFGCGLGQCGACTVLMDGKAVRSCALPVSAVKNRAITTLEGLGSVAHPHPIQTAFIEEQAAQCGYCMNGMILGAKALLDKNSQPSVAEIKHSLNNYICRCGSHLRVIRAIQRAAGAKA